MLQAFFTQLLYVATTLALAWLPALVALHMSAVRAGLA